VPRFTGFYNLPTTYLPAAPKGGFRNRRRIYRHHQQHDDTLKPPYTMSMDSTSAGVGHGFFRARRLCGTALAAIVDQQGSGNADQSGGSEVRPIVFSGAQIIQTQNLTRFECSDWSATVLGKHFPGSRKQHPDRDQRAASLYGSSCPGLHGALRESNQLLQSLVQHLRPVRHVQSQYSPFRPGARLARVRTTRRSRSASVQRRLMFDFNFTYGKSLDLASSSESGGSFGA